MRILLFPVFGLLISCGQSGSADKKEFTPKDTTDNKIDTLISEKPALPPVYRSPGEAPVNASLNAKYNGQWHVLNDSEAGWIKDAFDYFIVPKRKTEPDYPYITMGDFNADGRQDTAAVVTDSAKTRYHVAVLMGEGKTVFWKEDIMEDAALSTIPKSDIGGMDGEKTKKIKMKGDGINVEYFEKAAFVLYWDKNTFKRIQTAD